MEKENIGTNINDLMNNKSLSNEENDMVDQLINKLNKEPPPNPNPNPNPNPMPNPMPPQNQYPSPNIIPSNDSNIQSLLKKYTNLIVLFVLLILSNANLIESSDFFKNNTYLFFENKITYIAIILKSILFTLLYHLSLIFI